MTRLWSASPTTRTRERDAAAEAGTAFAHASMRHEREPEVDDADVAGEEAAQVARAEQVVLPRPALAGEVVGAAGRRFRKPVDERQPRVHLDREPPVRRRQEDAAPDPQGLGDEAPLAVAVAHVLDHRVREDDVEGAVGERQRACVTLDVRDRGIAATEPRRRRGGRAP